MIFRYDNKNVGFPAGEERRQIVGLNDIYATLCELTGIEVPYFSAQDSVSFANYISDDQQNAPRQELATFAFNYDVSFVLSKELISAPITNYLLNVCIRLISPFTIPESGDSFRELETRP